MNALKEYLRNLGIEGGIFGLAGLAAIGFGVLSILGTWPFNEKLSLQIMVGAVGTLLLALATQVSQRHASDERLKGIEEILKQNGLETKELSRLLKERNSVRPIMGMKQVYNEGMRIIALAERHIRATSIGKGPPSAPPELGDAYMDKLRKGLELGRPVRLDAVMGADSEFRVSSSQKRRIEERYKLYQDNDVLPSVHFYLAPAQVGLDLLIIDKGHMIITVPYRGGVEGFKYGLLFSNTPEIVEEFVDWFENVLREKAKPIRSPEDVSVFDDDSDRI